MNQWPNPFIEQRADPFILRDGSRLLFHCFSTWNMTGWRYAGPTSLEGLRTAAPVIIWRKPKAAP